VLCPADNFAKSFDLGEDGLGSGSPHEGLGMLIPVRHKAFDLAAQLPRWTVLAT